jgi:hypothetical protein
MRAIARTNSLFRISITRTPLSNLSRASVAAPRLLPSYSRASTHKQGQVIYQKTNMSTQSTQSQACCNTPAVVSKGYSPKGDYIEVDGLKTCMYRCNDFPILSDNYHRHHRSQGRKTRHSRRLRHLWILQPNTAGCGHSRIHR